MRKLSNEMKKKIALVMAICLLCGSLSVFPRIARADDSNEPAVEAVDNNSDEKVSDNADDVTKSEEAGSGEEANDNKSEVGQPEKNEEVNNPSEDSKEDPGEDQKPGGEYGQGAEEPIEFVKLDFHSPVVDQDSIVITDTDKNVVELDRIEKGMDYILIFTMKYIDKQVKKIELNGYDKTDDLKIVNAVYDSGDTAELTYELKFNTDEAELKVELEDEERTFTVLFEDASTDKTVVKDNWKLYCDNKEVKDKKILPNKNYEVSFTLADTKKKVISAKVNNVAVSTGNLIANNIFEGKYKIVFKSEGKDATISLTLTDREKATYRFDLSADDNIKVDYNLYDSENTKLDSNKTLIVEDETYTVTFDFDTYNYYLKNVSFNSANLDYKIITVDGKKLYSVSFKGKSRGGATLRIGTDEVDENTISLFDIRYSVLKPLRDCKNKYYKEGVLTCYFKDSVSFTTENGEDLSFDGKDYAKTITLKDKTEVIAYFLRDTNGTVKRRTLINPVYVDFDNDSPKFTFDTDTVFYRKIADKKYCTYPRGINYTVTDNTEVKYAWWNNEGATNRNYKLTDFENGKGVLPTTECWYNPENPITYFMAEDNFGNVTTEEISNVADNDPPVIVKLDVDRDTVSAQNGVLYAKQGVVKFWVYTKDGEGSGVASTCIQAFDKKGNPLDCNKFRFGNSREINLSAEDLENDDLKVCQKFEIECVTKDDTFACGDLFAYAKDNVGNESANGYKFDDKLVFSMYEPGIELVETPAKTVRVDSKDKYGETTIYYNPKDNLESVDLVLNVTDIQADAKKDGEDAPELKSIEIWDGYDYITKIGDIDLTDLPSNLKHIVEGLKLNVAVEENKTIKVKATSTNDREYEVSIKLTPDDTAPVIDAVTYNKNSFIAGNCFKYEAFDTNSISINMSANDVQSGTDVIKVKYISNDGEEVKEDTVDLSKESEMAYLANLSKFKGYLELTAVDKLGNASDPVKTKGFIIESKKDHENEEGHLSLAREDKGDDFIYNSAVKVPLTVVDNFAGIKDIEIVNDGNKKTSKDLEKDGWKIERDSCGLIVKAAKTITVDEDKDDIEYSVKITDNAGNITEKTDIVSIDKTRPEISLSLSGHGDEKYDTFFNTSRELTVTVKERNFDKKLIETEIANTIGAKFSISSWEHNVDKKNPNESTHTATITLDKDADYEIKVSGKDKANNTAETVKAGKFTIDTTRPGLEAAPNGLVTKEDNFSKTTGYANIVIEEPNFDESRVYVEGTYTSFAGEKSTITNANLTAFKHNGNTHTATIPLDKNGIYDYQVKLIDKAGNASEIKTYTDIKVDTIMPEVTITGVQNQQAYANGEESPVVTMTDENLSAESSKVTLVDGFGNVVNEFIRETKNTDSGKKIIVSFNDFSKDGVYKIIAEAYDKAGNLTRNEVEFSVNRNGSTFKIDQPKLINDQYLDKAPELNIYEINVTKIDENNVDILLGKNGSTKTLNHGVEYSFENTSVKGGWNQYKYVVKADNFDVDAEYEISAVSRDNNNHVKSSADTTKLAFILDTTAPTFDASGLTNDLHKKCDSYTVEALVEDNYSVASVDIKLNNQAVKVDTDGEGKYTFEIPSSNDPQEVSVRVVDGANHVCEKTYSNILISKDGLTLPVGNNIQGNDYTLLFSIIGAFAAIVFIVVLIVIKRRKTTVVVRNR